MSRTTLSLLVDEDREQFILDNQYAFKYGASLTEPIEEGEIISRGTIEKCIDDGVAYRICYDGRIVGGLVLKLDSLMGRNYLELLFIHPDEHNKGIGYAAWKEVERLYPDTRIWETCTPCFEMHNVYFYVNKCGFHIVEVFKDHSDMDPDEDDADMFRFEKHMDSAQVLNPGEATHVRQE